MTSNLASCPSLILEYPPTGVKTDRDQPLAGFLPQEAGSKAPWSGRMLLKHRTHLRGLLPLCFIGGIPSFFGFCPFPVLPLSFSLALFGEFFSLPAFTAFFFLGDCRLTKILIAYGFRAEILLPRSPRKRRAGRRASGGRSPRGAPRQWVTPARPQRTSGGERHTRRPRPHF